MVRTTGPDATDRLVASRYPSPIHLQLMDSYWAVMLTLLPFSSRPRRIKSPKMS